MAEMGVGIPDTFLHACLFARRLISMAMLRHAAGDKESRPGRDHPYGRHAVLHCPRRRCRSGRLGRPSKRSSLGKEVAREVRNEVVAAVARTPRAMATAGTAVRLEVTAAEEAAAASVVPAVVATAAAADLMMITQGSRPSASR